MRSLIKNSTKKSGRNYASAQYPVPENRSRHNLLTILYYEVKDNDYPNIKNTERKLQTKEKTSTNYQQITSNYAERHLHTMDKQDLCKVHSTLEKSIIIIHHSSTG